MAVDVGLTDFVNFATEAGRPKLQKVKELRNRGAYEPSHDFWKPLRDPIVRHHRQGVCDNSDLDAIVPKLKDPRKQNLYPSRVAGYERFLRKKNISWFEPPAIHHVVSPDVTIRVKPDLGLTIDGVPHVLKLYFSEKKLTKLQKDLYLTLMSEALAGEVPPGTQFALLDVSRGKLYATPNANPALLPLVAAEALALGHMWHSMN